MGYMTVRVTLDFPVAHTLLESSISIQVAVTFNSQHGRNLRTLFEIL